MCEFALPRALAQEVEPTDSPDSPLRTWTATLPAVIERLARHWVLTLGSPFQPGGRVSWVAPARTAMGTSVVLKVGLLHDESRHEADGLRIWDGHGAVRVIDAVVLDQTSALLIEACHPGTALAGAVTQQEQDLIVADLLRRLWIAPPADHPFRTLHAMCQNWADEFEARYRALRDRGQDPGLIRAGMRLFRELASTADHTALLCTDLHANNVLRAQREPWLVIDPKPHVGDPTYDVLQHMLNCPERLHADPVGLARRMAGLLDLDASRLEQWLFARCVHESLDEPRWLEPAWRLTP